jgi:hypothetical protein
MGSEVERCTLAIKADAIANPAAVGRARFEKRPRFAGQKKDMGTQKGLQDDYRGVG